MMILIVGLLGCAEDIACGEIELECGPNVVIACCDGDACDLAVEGPMGDEIAPESEGEYERIFKACQEASE